MSKKPQPATSNRPFIVGDSLTSANLAQTLRPSAQKPTSAQPTTHNPNTTQGSDK